jgi:C-terminal processing protease CtpA/Prc
MLSCCEKNNYEPVLSDREVINSWIKENMEYYYLWNDRIDVDEINKDENPEQYFRKFIVPEDRYSFIEDDFTSLLLKLSGHKKAGYACFLYLIDGDVMGKITYVVKGSPADKIGLKRGMLFTKINGTNLMKDNYKNLISQINDNHILTVWNDNMETDYNVSTIEFAENPVFLDTVYDLHNCKIGYLVYNSFISDNDDFSQQYDIQLNDVFQKFRDEKINELILDLRYNSKGHIFSSMIMASLIVRDLNTKDIFAQYQYNNLLQQTIRNEFGDDYLNMYYTNVINNEELNNIGDQLNRVFILTSPKTGVMGEILINSLQSSMDVIVVGNKTIGQNVFSIFLYEDDPEKQKINTWTIAPAIMQISNKSGNTNTIFIPDIEITEPLRDDTPLGDVNEKVLSSTLDAIYSSSHLSEIAEGENIIPQELSNFLD